MRRTGYPPLHAHIIGRRAVPQHAPFFSGGGWQPRAQLRFFSPRVDQLVCDS